jgi:hypothetical protein
MEEVPSRIPNRSSMDEDTHQHNVQCSRPIEAVHAVLCVGLDAYAHMHNALISVSENHQREMYQ